MKWNEEEFGLLGTLPMSEESIGCHNRERAATGI